MTYYGYFETDFKARYYTHILSFKNPFTRNQTELLKLVWNLKDAGHSSAFGLLRAGPLHTNAE